MVFLFHKLQKNIHTWFQKGLNEPGKSPAYFITLEPSSMVNALEALYVSRWLLHVCSDKSVWIGMNGHSRWNIPPYLYWYVWIHRETKLTMRISVGSHWWQIGTERLDLKIVLLHRGRILSLMWCHLRRPHKVRNVH